jgi:membrane dipeptidase
MIRIIDGHNDVLARPEKTPGFDFVAGTETGHLDLASCLASGFAGGLFAVFIAPTESEKRRPRRFAESMSTPAAVPLERAGRAAARMFLRLKRYTESSQGRLRIARSVSELEQALGGEHVAAVCHFEGAEPIDRDLNALDLYYEAGLRSVGIVWSRPNRFATGVPFATDRTPDVGPGLTSAGRELVRRCNELGVMVDVSHLNLRGFYDVARLTHAPLVASHSNAYALSPCTRNLTDDQLAAIRDSDGLVGLNFGTAFLRADGQMSADTPLSRMREHIDYLAERVGIDRVAFGSDFDGAIVPGDLGGVAGLPKLLSHLSEAGYTEEELCKLAHRNWLRVLSLTLR